MDANANLLLRELAGGLMYMHMYELKACKTETAFYMGVLRCTAVAPPGALDQALPRPFCWRGLGTPVWGLL
jgi:hypothetical protein